MQKIKSGIYIIDTESTFASIRKVKSQWKVLGFSIKGEHTHRFHTVCKTLTEAQEYVEVQ
jgi:hypothetical protein